MEGSTEGERERGTEEGKEGGREGGRKGGYVIRVVIITGRMEECSLSNTIATV